MSNGPYPWDEESSMADDFGREVPDPDEGKPQVVFHRMNKGMNFPRRMTEGAAGFDLIATAERRLRGGWTEYSTGIAVSIPEGYVGLVRGRSGLAFKHGITAYEGTIDADYRGELKVLLRDVPSNMSLVGERIAQLVIVPFVGVSVCTDDQPGDTTRGTGGFGSTGRKG